MGRPDDSTVVEGADGWTDTSRGIASELAKAKTAYLRARRRSAAASAAEGKARRSPSGSFDSICHERVARPHSTAGADISKLAHPHRRNEESAVAAEAAPQGVPPLPSHLIAQLADAGLRRLGLTRPPDADADLDAVLFEPPPPPRRRANFGSAAESAAEGVEDLERRLVVEIRTSGLRTGRENALVGLVREMRSAREKAAAAAAAEAEAEAKGVATLGASSVGPAVRDMIRSWTSHADAVAAASGRELDASDRRVEEAIRSAERSEEARKDAEERLACSVEQGRRVREEVERSAAELEQRVAERQRNFLEAMEREVAKVQTDLRDEVGRASEQARRVAEEDAQRRIDELASQLDEARGETKILRDETERLASALEKSEIELVRLEQSGKESESETRRVMEEMQSELDIAHLTVAKGEGRVRSLEEELDQVKEESAAEEKRRERERKDELDEIEDRVRKILHSKEDRIKELGERATRSEERAKAAENFIKRLENGFDVPE